MTFRTETHGTDEHDGNVRSMAEPEEPDVPSASIREYLDAVVVD